MSKIGGALLNLATQGVDAAMGFEHFRMQTGGSIAELQKWQVGAKLAGLSADFMATSFVKVQDTLTRMDRYGGERPLALGRLGISAYRTGTRDLKNVFEIMKEIAGNDRFWSLVNRPGEQRALLSSLVTDPGQALEVLKLMRAGKFDLSGTHGIDSTELKTMVGVGKEWNKAKQSAEDIGYALMTGGGTFLQCLTKAREALEGINTILRQDTWHDFLVGLGGGTKDSNWAFKLDKIRKGITGFVVDTAIGEVKGTNLNNLLHGADSMFTRAANAAFPIKQEVVLNFTMVADGVHQKSQTSFNFEFDPRAPLSRQELNFTQSNIGNSNTGGQR